MGRAPRRGRRRTAGVPGRAAGRTRPRRGRRAGRGRRPRSARRRRPAFAAALPGGLLVEALGAAQQLDLAEPGLGVGVGRASGRAAAGRRRRPRRGRRARSRRRPRRTAGPASGSAPPRARRRRRPPPPGRSRRWPRRPAAARRGTARTCASGSAPWNSGTGWPFTTANTAGMLCTWKAWPSRGLASRSTLASSQRPPSAAASRSSTGLSCLHGPHQSAQKSMTTGTVIDWSTTGLEVGLGDVDDHAGDRAAGGRRRPSAAGGWPAVPGAERAPARSTAPYGLMLGWPSCPPGVG